LRGEAQDQAEAFAARQNEVDPQVSTSLNSSAGVGEAAKNNYVMLYLAEVEPKSTFNFQQKQKLFLGISAG
jgi:hypothetical protein